MAREFDRNLELGIPKTEVGIELFAENLRSLNRAKVIKSAIAQVGDRNFHTKS